ncbi:MAG: hypothetical protein WC139_06515, partial [Candidatus Kapaibacterium sp.]
TTKSIRTLRSKAINKEKLSPQSSPRRITENTKIKQEILKGIKDFIAKVAKKSKGRRENKKQY